MEKEYKVPFSRQDYGYIIVKAKNKEEATELVMSGEFTNDDMYIKGGETIADGEPVLLNE